MKRILLILCAVLSGCTGIRMYDRVDFAVNAGEVPARPWLQEEACMDMHLVSPSGKELTLPCFWVEGDRFEARFTPQEQGTYTYSFHYSLNGQEPVVLEENTFKVRGCAGKGILHPNGNWTFVYDDGSPFRGVAENICWESRDSDDSRFFSELHQQADRFNYDVMLPAFAQAGGNFVRVWMCSWNFPIDRQRHFNNSRYQESEDYFNPSATARLDHVLELAEQLDVKFMLCMGPGNARTDASFFTSEEAKARYRNYLRYIVARWGYSPSIGLWEFFNEIDNIQFRDAKNPIPAEDIVAWHTEMAAYLKSIDAFGHPVTTSISHRDLAGLNDVPDIDLNQKHIYCATSSIPGTIVSYETAHGKPYVIGEFSYEWDWSKNFDDFAEDMDRDFKRGLWYGLLSPTPITPMSWWWEYFDNRGLVPYFRNVRHISDRMLKNGKGSFEPVKAEAGGADALAVRCGKHVYLYVYNNTDAVVENVSVDTSFSRAYTLDFEKSSLRPCSKELQLSLEPGQEALFELL